MQVKYEIDGGTIVCRDILEALEFIDKEYDLVYSNTDKKITLTFLNELPSNTVMESINKIYTERV